MNLETALLIVPPPEIQAFAAPLRERYTPLSFVQGPAHLTLFFPFVPPEAVEDTIESLTAVCAQVPSFPLTLDRYGRFETTHFLQPADPQELIELHRRLSALVPGYPPYDGEYGPDLFPHLTLAQCETKAEADAVQLPPTPSLSFTVDRLHLYLGPPEQRVPWVPVAIIHLRGHP